MGEVYLAEHRLLKRACALKVIRPERASDPRALGRFEHEVRATARLSDPNIVEVYDYGRAEDGTSFYVMEFLHGLNLDDLVGRHGPMPPGRVIYLLRQACLALAEAHGAGLIHRDLKPSNIVVARRGRRHDFVKLVDFGLVELTGEQHEPGPTHERAVGGTPQYMAPEQIARDRALDRRCDLYALGGVAYTLLTGRPPFEGETATEVMNAHVRDPVVPPSRHRADIPSDLEQVVLRCLAKDPDGRFQGAEELETALSACGRCTSGMPERPPIGGRRLNRPTQLSRPRVEGRSSPGSRPRGRSDRRAQYRADDQVSPRDSRIWLSRSRWYCW